MISSPTTNPDQVPDGSKDCPRISPAIGWYMLLEKNKSDNFSDGHRFACEFYNKPHRS